MLLILTSVCVTSALISGIYIGFLLGKRIFTQREIEMYKAIGYDLEKIEAEKAEYQERINKLETTMRLHNIEPGV
ncbi:MAG: hypothetical protein AMXMBFR48_15280 [Ignavibacteriales bacterium]